MTREEAIKVIRKMLAYTDLSDRANLTADMVDACHLAIKILEQEPILDKITEIIEPLRHLSIDEMSDIEWLVLRMIDKYKAETEE